VLSSNSNGILAKERRIRIDARGAEAEFRAAPITHTKVVSSVVEKFGKKYGAKDVKKYYSKFDVAVAMFGQGVQNRGLQ
jgi:hypothetical protein